MPGSPRSGKDWYSPYFTPTTIVVAAAVLLISVQAGRLAGNLVVSRDRAHHAPPTNAVVAPPANHARTKAAHHRSPERKNASPLAKTSG